MKNIRNCNKLLGHHLTTLLIFIKSVKSERRPLGNKSSGKMKPIRKVSLFPRTIQLEHTKFNTRKKNDLTVSFIAQIFVHRQSRANVLLNNVHQRIYAYILKIRG